MVFSIKTHQFLNFGLSATTGYWALKRSLRCITHFARAISGLESIEDRVEIFLIDLFAGESSIKKLVFGAEEKKARTLHVKKCFKSACEVAIFGFISYAAFAALNRPQQEVSISDSVEKIGTLYNQIHELRDEALPLIKKWHENVCHNEAIQWEMLPFLADCLDPSSVNPPDLSTKKYGQTNATVDRTVNCQDLMQFLQKIAFYQVDLFRERLKYVRSEFYKMLNNNEEVVKKIQYQWSSLLSEKYFGNAEHLWLGRFVIVNYKLLCRWPSSEVFNGVGEDCSPYKEEINRYEQELDSLQRIVFFADEAIVHCRKLRVDSKERAGSLFLPHDFFTLIQENNLEEAERYFDSHGGSRSIASMKFNFSSIPNPNENVSVEGQMQALKLRSSRSTARSLNSKARYRNFVDDSPHSSGSNEILNRLLGDLKETVVA